MFILKIGEVYNAKSVATVVTVVALVVGLVAVSHALETPLPSPTATALGSGQDCGSDSQCQTGYCSDGVCCAGRCGTGRCDIAGKKGTCSFPNDLGGPCFKSTDCDSKMCSAGVCVGPTRTPSSTKTETPTATPRPPTVTATPTDRIIHVDIVSAIAEPVSHPEIAIELHNSGGLVASTENEIHFDPTSLILTADACRVDPSLDRTISVSIVAAGDLLVIVQPTASNDPLPDGLLYTCTVTLPASTLPGNYPLTTFDPIAFSPTGRPLSNVVGSSGTVFVSVPSSWCIGDCDDSGEVTIEEIITMVNVAVGVDNVSTCDRADVNRDGKVTIEEIIGAIGAALGRCA